MSEALQLFVALFVVGAGVGGGSDLAFGLYKRCTL